MNLKKALDDPLWLQHKIGDIYTLINRGGGEDPGWKIAYYPLFGTYIGKTWPYDGAWIDFNEPRALIEKPLKKGTDFREVALRYLTKKNLTSYENNILL